MEKLLTIFEFSDSKNLKIFLHSPKCKEFLNELETAFKSEPLTFSKTHLNRIALSIKLLGNEELQLKQIFEKYGILNDLEFIKTPIIFKRVIAAIEQHNSKMYFKFDGEYYTLKFNSNEVLFQKDDNYEFLNIFNFKKGSLVVSPLNEIKKLNEVWL